MSLSLRSELAPTLRLAVPVVLAELGWMAMGVVDTVMVGPLGPEAIGAVGVAVSIQMALTIFGMGVLLGLDTLVSQAFGAGDLDDCHRWLFDGLTLAALLTVPTMISSGVIWLAIPSMGFHPLVAPLLQRYFSVLLWSTVPLLFYASCRRYLQGIHHVTPIMFALVSANVMNAVGNYALIYGHWGFPRLGIVGSAWATVLARVYILAVLAVTIFWFRGSGHTWHVFRFDWSRLARLWRLGFPAASQFTAEVGVFALATMMAGMLDPISSASHQIALNMAGVAFMIPLGLASAGAVRVGHAVGAGDPHRAAASGWMAIALGVAFMTASGLLFLVLPRQLIGLFTTDPSVVELGTSLLFIAAVFQLFDGVQGVVTGTLRGIGDTRTPMIVNLGAHWLLGLPVSYTLCFLLGWGVRGLWIGLSLGLIVTGVILIYVWTSKIHQYQISHSLTPQASSPRPQASSLKPQASSPMIICDSHVHFFSPNFFRALGATPERVAEIGMEFPEFTEALADLWIAQLDANGVARCSLIASTPTDADSVAIAIARHPSRFVGFFMLDPTKDGWETYATKALDAGHRTICLFPAMHQYSTRDRRVDDVFQLAAGRPGTVVFVHCGELSVGIRGKLGLPNTFDPTLGNPRFLKPRATRYSSVPIIIPHFGGTMHEQAAYLADGCANVYLDTSSSNSWLARTPKALTLADQLNVTLGLVGADHILFGSDSSFFPRGWNRAIIDAQAAAFDELDLGENERGMILGGNFQRLFKGSHD